MEALLWRHNGRDGVSNHQTHNCLLNRSFRLRSKKTSKLRVTGLCVGNSQVTGEFPAQMASNAENVSIWWRHHRLLWVASNRWHLISSLCHIIKVSMFNGNLTYCVLIQLLWLFLHLRHQIYRFLTEISALEQKWKKLISYKHKVPLHSFSCHTKIQ